MEDDMAIRGWTAARLPDTEYTDRPWRLHEIGPDFLVEDVWALPTPGGPDELDRLVRALAGGAELEPGMIYRALFAIRWWIGRRLGWDGQDSGIGTRVPTVRDRLPQDLKDGPRGHDFATVPFVAIYQTEREYVAEIANRTVHALMHIGWVQDATGERYHGIMTALVRPNGLFGTAYMVAIKPFRRALVYPDLIRAIGKQWPQYT
jgi:Protein of unknown function (DUF2867)